ncbi:MAG: hypothetical protein GY788_01420 [bacterium]|nr:hypothetical protein [bacterium]
MVNLRLPLERPPSGLGQLQLKTEFQDLEDCLGRYHGEASVEGFALGTRLPAS